MKIVHYAVCKETESSQDDVEDGVAGKAHATTATPHRAFRVFRQVHLVLVNSSKLVSIEVSFPLFPIITNAFGDMEKQY